MPGQECAGAAGSMGIWATERRDFAALFSYREGLEESVR
jgi:hypothetical protein